VGLEKGDTSGSEAGHLNIGAGRIIKQESRRILESISNGSFFMNPVLLSTVRYLRKKPGPDIHLVGMMGTGDSPHSHPDIVLALLSFLRWELPEKKVFLHLFTDGRDSYANSTLEHWKKWKWNMDCLGNAELATFCGRFYGMDRTKKWDRLLKAYKMITQGKGRKCLSFEEGISEDYQAGISDEFIRPSVLVGEDYRPKGLVKKGDAVIFFNFRSDRARHLTKLFANHNLRKREPQLPTYQIVKDLFLVTMTDFGPGINTKTAFYTPPLLETLPVALRDLRQLYVAETEKFAHITYFINGGYAEPVGGEERLMIPSPDVRSYDQVPEMSAKKITGAILKSLQKKKYQVIVANFANADMLGHTGNFDATVKGVKVVDEQLALIHEEIKKQKGTLIVTADHGNADVMLDKRTGRVFNFHTQNPIPFVVVAENRQWKKVALRKKGVLASIAPTILDILGVKKPRKMTEKSLIRR
jgi:2,3-bisphosphoglycerate-independent phosphoglycerate mutase